MDNYSGLQKVDIELVGSCNAKCVYCTWHTRPKSTRRLIKEELAYDLLDQIGRIDGLSTVGLQGVGEPLMHPRIRNIVEYAVDKNIEIGFSTNCTFLDKHDWLSEIVDIEVNLAVPWTDKGLIPKSVENAINYLELNPKNKDIFVQMVCHQDVEYLYDRFIKVFAPYQDKVTLFAKQPLTWPYSEWQFGFTPRERSSVKVVIDELDVPRSIGEGCTQPDYYLLVLANGTFVPCCVGHFPGDWGIGNANEISIAQAWANNLKAKEAYGICKYCSSRDYRMEKPRVDKVSSSPRHRGFELGI